MLSAEFSLMKKLWRYNKITLMSNFIREDLGQRLPQRVLRSAFLLQLTRALLNSLGVLRTKVLDLGLVLARQLELVLA